MKVILLLLAILASISARSAHPYPHFLRLDGDYAASVPEALYLTPLIKAGNITVAQEAAKVRVEPFNKFNSYSGYLTVKEEYNSNLFFWYVESENDPMKDPLVLWLQGGPGCTSLIGFLLENGPLLMDDNGEIAMNNYSWHKNHNVIYIDSPVGTGFSFTDSEDGYVRDEVDVGRDLHEAVKQLHLLFPQFQQMKFFITGESYGGKYVPALGYQILKEKEQNQHLCKTNATVDIQLAGLAIGNGLSDPINQINYGDYLYQLGFIDINTLNVFHIHEKKTRDCIEKGNLNYCTALFWKFVDMFRQYSGFEWYYNFLKTVDSMPRNAMTEVFENLQTRAAIHVGQNRFHGFCGNEIGPFRQNDITKSVAPWISELLDHYRMCIYNGQLDVVVAYPLTVNYLQHLKFNGSEIYKTAKRNIWRVDGEIAGYTKEANNLLEILVRNAGHMVPRDQPKWAFDMISRFTSGRSFK